MSSIFNAVRRLLPLAKPKGLVGHDLQGNRYFEIPNPAGGRMKRFVEYKKYRDLSEYTRTELRPPVQWRAWLSHTRPNPPSLTELQSDFDRQSSLQPKIAAIEAREREERIRQGYLLPDGSELPLQGDGQGQIAGPSTSSERKAQNQRFVVSPAAAPTTAESSSTTESKSKPQHVNALNSEEATKGYAIPTPSREDIAPPRETINPAEHASREELRKLAEEDTKRRIKETGGVDQQQQQQQQQHQQETGTAGTGAGLQPRRRGKK
ncbi:hypothetical protein CI109_103775 [Kwoniella shandongensis]|uniref:Uncharacterized protein n=1 Tax=Kwoniella shandongensis TaxID=1734106 RepID=A0A5M6C755_9TREE|nr:uncharacterized protein CI109_000528 [Kwoniella shandongensis]KAA5530956.1 hypothetical protein CI109_000528 [Kwoniella shandongensis]